MDINDEPLVGGAGEYTDTNAPKYTDADLVSFGKYLLSPERSARIEPILSEQDVVAVSKRIRLQEVFHADIENWKAK